MATFKTGDKVVLASDRLLHGRVAAISGDGKKVFVRWWNREVEILSPDKLLFQRSATVTRRTRRN